MCTCNRPPHTSNLDTFCDIAQFQAASYPDTMVESKEHSSLQRRSSQPDEGKRRASGVRAATATAKTHLPRGMGVHNQWALRVVHGTGSAVVIAGS